MAAAILITGANRGLGFEFASQYSADGWRVFAACRCPATATKLQRVSTARFRPVTCRALCGIGAASGSRKSEEPPLLPPIMRQIPGEQYEPCGRQLDGLLADQDRANDFSEGLGEALTGVRVGQPLSRESSYSGCRHRAYGGRQHTLARQRERPDDPAWSETLACADAPCARTGRLSWFLLS